MISEDVIYLGEEGLMATFMFVLDEEVLFEQALIFTLEPLPEQHPQDGSMCEVSQRASPARAIRVKAVNTEPYRTESISVVPERPL